MGYTRNKMFPFHPHPYGVRLKWKRTLPRAKNMPLACFLNALSSPAWRIKNGVSRMGYAIFGTSVLIGLFEKPCHTKA